MFAEDGIRGTGARVSGIMENSGTEGAAASNTPVATADDAQTPTEGGEVSAHADMAADAILGDVFATSDPGADLGDLHAALLSLSNDTFAYLDIALDHLTSSSDLFDAPALDHGDLPYDGSDAG